PRSPILGTRGSMFVGGARNRFIARSETTNDRRNLPPPKAKASDSPRPREATLPSSDATHAEAGSRRSAIETITEGGLFRSGRSPLGRFLSLRSNQCPSLGCSPSRKSTGFGVFSVALPLLPHHRISAPTAP